MSPRLYIDGAPIGGCDGIAIRPRPTGTAPRSPIGAWGVTTSTRTPRATRSSSASTQREAKDRRSATQRRAPKRKRRAAARPDRDASFAGTLVGHHNRVTALAFARCPGVEHLLLSGSADRTVRLWDVADGRCVKILRGHAVDVTALATSQRVPDLAVSGDRSGKLLVWRFGGGARTGPRQTLEPLDASPALCLAMSPSVHGRGGVRASRAPVGVYVLSGDDVGRAELVGLHGPASSCAWMLDDRTMPRIRE